MPDRIEITEDRVYVSVDETRIEVVSVGTQGPAGPKGDQGDPATNLVSSVAGKQGDVALSKADVGLEMVDNTADVDKPVSTAQQAAFNDKATKLNIPQFSIPIRDAPGSGEPNASRAYAIAAGVNAIAVRGGAGTLQAATATLPTELTTKAQMDALVPIYGTGFPNGVVTATVGRTYVDTNATNGAIEWKKATGTGNTGWVVSVGDTGWRDIASLIDAGSTSSVGWLRVRRIDSTVIFWIDNVAPASSNQLIMTNLNSKLGIGFAPSTISAALITGFGSPSLNRAAVVGGQSSEGLKLFGGTAAVWGQIPYTTVQAWPSALPGIAVA